MKRKRFIAELNEAEVTVGGLRVSNQEYHDVKEYWENLVYEKVTSLFSGTSNKEKKLVKSSSSAAFADTQNE